MNRPLGIILLVAGVLLAFFGIQASESFGSDVSRFFTGTPTDKSVWMLIGGVACIAAGLFMTLRGRSTA